MSCNYQIVLRLVVSTMFSLKLQDLIPKLKRRIINLWLIIQEWSSFVGKFCQVCRQNVTLALRIIFFNSLLPLKVLNVFSAKTLSKRPFDDCICCIWQKCVLWYASRTTGVIFPLKEAGTSRLGGIYVLSWASQLRKDLEKYRGSQKYQ